MALAESTGHPRIPARFLGEDGKLVELDKGW